MSSKADVVAAVQSLVSLVDQLPDDSSVSALQSQIVGLQAQVASEEASLQADEAKIEKAKVDLS